VTDTAALLHEDRIYFTESFPARHAPHSAITDLIQGIWREQSELARKILRNRIFATTARLDPMERGMVKVAAKRVTVGLRPDDIHQRLDPEGTRSWVKVSRTAPPALASLAPGEAPWEWIAKALEQGSEKALRPRYEQDRAVAAALISPDGAPLAAALNSNATDRTRHAEINLLQGWWEREKKPLPPGSRILVSLQCCRMCAGMVWRMAEDPLHIRVDYLQKDSGPMAQGTILQAGSPERRLESRSPLELKQELEFHLGNGAPSSS
jgi:hypothetical protein